MLAFLQAAKLSARLRARAVVAHVGAFVVPPHCPCRCEVASVEDVGRRNPSQGRSGAAVGPRPLCRRPAGPGRHAARPRHPLAASRTPRSSRIDAAEALAQDGVWAVITGEDVRKLSDPFLVALKAPVHQWSLAVERVRYVGEPVALVVAESRYLAEDAAELVQIEYAAARSGDRSARGVQAVGAAPARRGQDQRDFGPQVLTTATPRRAFEQADTRVALTCDFHRLSFTPMECYVVVAEYNPADGSYDVLANFQGPFSTHPVMARALRVPGPEAAAAHPARQRRQLRHQALGVSLHRADGDRGAASPAGR